MNRALVAAAFVLASALVILPETLRQRGCVRDDALTLGVSTWLAGHSLVFALPFRSRVLRNRAVRVSAIGALLFWCLAALTLQITPENPCSVLSCQAAAIVEDALGLTLDESFWWAGEAAAKSFPGTYFASVLYGLMLDGFLLGFFAVALLWNVSVIPVDRERRTSKCQTCGYDLRGSVEFGRCPECGSTFAEVDVDRPPVRQRRPSSESDTTASNAAHDERRDEQQNRNSGRQQ